MEANTIDNYKKQNRNMKKQQNNVFFIITCKSTNKQRNICKSNCINN